MPWGGFQEPSRVMDCGTPLDVDRSLQFHDMLAGRAHLGAPLHPSSHYATKSSGCNSRIPARPTVRPSQAATSRHPPAPPTLRTRSDLGGTGRPGLALMATGGVR